MIGTIKAFLAALSHLVKKSISDYKEIKKLNDESENKQ